MKIKSKKLFFVLISIIFIYIIGVKSINNDEHNIYFKIKSLIPNSIKHYLKNTIFLIPSLNKTINELKKENESLKDINNQNINLLKEIKNKHFAGSFPLITFNIKEKNKIIKSRYSTYKLSTFKTNYLHNGKAIPAKASAYIDEFEDKIFLVNADGIFSYFYKNDLNKDKFDSIVIPSNIKEIINYPAFYKKSENGIKDILIVENDLFVSFTNKLPDDCYNTSIMVANINLEYLDFEKFFVPKKCIYENNEYGWINHHIVGGRMVNFKKNKILLSTGAMQNFKLPQEKNNPFGKILSIDKTTSSWEIISMGHRNIQGLKYDKKRDIIFSTEHGPTGGDEFNINFNPDSVIIENFGWPISSYGEHGAKTTTKNSDELNLRYQKAPLHKSHKKFGFIEPTKYYVPSIGITEIEMIPKEFNKEFNNDFFIASMGTIIEEGDMSIHHIKLDDDLKKIIKEDLILIGERIRDFKYLKDINKIILFMENSPGIGVLSLQGLR